MKPKFYRKILENGMTVILEKRKLPVVSVAFAVRNGGNNEFMDEKGISHFIEHMLYKGTPKRNARRIAEEIEKNGGDLNGFTSEELTAYWCKIPSKHFNIALDVLSDIVKNPLFDEDELEKERKVIFEEIKMYHDTPRLYVFDEIQKNLFGGVMDVEIIGTHETMNSLNRDKLVKKFTEIYKPNNMILCVVGDADFDEIIKFAENNFGNEKGSVPEQKVLLKNKVNVEKRKGIDQANLVFGYHVPVSEDKKNYSARILSAIMAEGMSSRLFSEIREKRNLAYAIKGSSNINKGFAYNFIFVGTGPENVDKVKELIIDEFKKVSEGIDEKEFNDAKEQLIGQYQISMEDSQTQLVNLLGAEISGKNGAKDFYNFEKNIRNVKVEDVMHLAKKVAQGDYSFFALVPED